eukprot:135242-Amphidinium_carterae.1
MQLGVRKGPQGEFNKHRAHQQRQTATVRKKSSTTNQTTVNCSVPITLHSLDTSLRKGVRKHTA